MLYLFGFDTIGVVVGDLYFRDPRPGPGGQRPDEPERGVRLEVRRLESPEQAGSPYAARPILVGRPLWRADLLEAVDHPGTLDRAHHHPRMQGWEPLRRQFEPDMTEDAIAWVGHRLATFRPFLAGIGGDGPDAAPVDDIPDSDFEELAAAVPDITAAIERTLDRIRAGELARVPAGAGTATLIRTGWL